jgi:quercetin dioxygenase-like cupin family protein
MSGDMRAAEYVLGLLDAKARADVARAAESDAALREDIAWWERKLAPIETADAGAPPAGLLDRIVARIEVAGVKEVPALPGTVTLRAHEGAWESLPELGNGVERRMLWDDPQTGRHAYLVRLPAGGTVRWHAHPADEECYVISGDLNFGPLKLKAGDFHLAKRGVAHPPATSNTGAVFMIATQH